MQVQWRSSSTSWSTCPPSFTWTTPWQVLLGSRLRDKETILVKIDVFQPKRCFKRNSHFLSVYLLDPPLGIHRVQKLWNFGHFTPIYMFLKAGSSLDRSGKKIRFKTYIFMVKTQVLLYWQACHILACIWGNTSRKAVKFSRANSYRHVLGNRSFLGLVWEENTILENIFMIYTQALLYRQKSHILAYTGGNASRKAFKISRANSNTHVLEKISFLCWFGRKIRF